MTDSLIQPNVEADLHKEGSLHLRFQAPIGSFAPLANAVKVNTVFAGTSRKKHGK